jgi:hypothetical protein
MTIIAYPRGFLGVGSGTNETQQSPGDYARLLTAVKLNKQITAPKSSYLPHPGVKALWLSYMEGAGTINNMVFRERVLMTALQVFTSEVPGSFYHWCKLQEKSPFFTSNHRRFLNDTFRFIETGARGIQLLTWVSIVKCDPYEPSSAAVAYEVDSFFGSQKASTDGTVSDSKSNALADNLCRWTQHLDGFNDLLGTMNILFGDA